MSAPVSRTRRPEARPDEILDAALAVFSEQGFAGARVEDIAKRAGLSKGAIYLYFESKDAMLKGLVRRLADGVVGAAEGLVDPNRDASVTLRSLVAFMVVQISNPHVSAAPRIVIAEAQRFPELAAFYRETVIARGHRLLTRLIDLGVSQGVFRDVDRESPLAVTLVQGISSGDRMDITLRKAVELGVAAIVPVATERSVVKLRDERADRRRQHWQALAIAACEQCGRNTVPAIAEPVDFRAWLAALPKDPGTQSRIALAVGGDAGFTHLPKPGGNVLLLVGPEGGLSPEEATLAASRGFTAIRMGPRILRTETAAVVAMAAMQTLWGDL
jgi:16S rRNA (uracil1498-N3)-methyltransferase